MVIKKYVEVKCSYCGESCEKELKEYNRRVKLGKTKFYCNNSCSAKENPALLNQQKFNLTRSSEDLIAPIRNWQKYNKYSYEDELSPFRYIVRKIKQRIKTKITKKCGSLDFDLTPEYLKNLWEFQKGICPYTNITMALTQTIGKAAPYQSSLDRIDSSRGYIQGNVEFVCLSVNYAKNTFSTQEMKDFFSLVNTSNQINI